MGDIIMITFKCGQKIFQIGAAGLYDVSGLTEKELIDFKRPFVESFKRVHGDFSPYRMDLLK